ncbi:hypothetical protein [Actibacterium sp.]|uniref:hypothetical protein n=1 Tax=Actibacterium sp. TaxID=1872125 RepID=UPI003569669A
MDTAEFLSRHGGVIAQRLSPEISARYMAATILSKRDKSQTFLLRYAQQKKIIKHYDITDGPGQTAYLRERDALRTFSKSGLVPRLEFFSDQAGFLAIEYLEGADLRAVVHPDSLDILSASVGRWLGQFAEASPYKRETGNWGDYLRNYEALQQSGIIRESEAFLKAFAYDRLVMAKNDGALSNLRFTEDGRLYGIDLERSQFKPLGWDLLLTARALIRLFPEHADQITANLAKGFCQKTGENTDKYTTFLRIAGVTAAFEIGTGTTETPALAALRRYNAVADTPADLVGSAPFLPARMVRQDPDAVARLKTHLQTVDLENDGPLTTYSARSDLVAPPQALRALCMACQGSCCSRGAQHNAFLDASALNRTARLMDLQTRQRLVDLYLDHLPDTHVEDSCLFHDKTGCALPRKFRSDTCNTYTCRSADRLIRQIDTHRPEDVLCVAGKGANFRKAVRTENGKIIKVPLSRLTLNGDQTSASQTDEETDNG